MLILETGRDDLLKPLQAVTGIVERKHTLPILSNILLQSENGQVQLLATDLEIQIHTLGAQGAQPDFRITTNAKKLQDILRALPDSSTVQLDLADHKLTLKAGKSRFNLQTLPAQDFPTMNVDENTSAAFALPQETLKHMISQVQHSMAVQDIRFYLNGLLMQTEGNQLRLVATDGHRLAFTSATLDTELPKQDVILPRKTVLELNKLLTQPKENVVVELLDNQVRFRCNDTVIVSKVIDGRFPDYNRVIPMDNKNIFVIDRLSLLGALERSSIWPTKNSAACACWCNRAACTSPAPTTNRKKPAKNWTSPIRAKAWMWASTSPSCWICCATCTATKCNWPSARPTAPPCSPFRTARNSNTL